MKRLTNTDINDLVQFQNTMEHLSTVRPNLLHKSSTMTPTDQEINDIAQRVMNNKVALRAALLHVPEITKIDHVNEEEILANASKNATEYVKKFLQCEKEIHDDLQT